MDDPRRRIRWYRHEFEHRSAGVWSDNQQTLLSLVLVLHETDGVAPRILDIDISNLVPTGAVSDVRESTLR